MALKDTLAKLRQQENHTGQNQQDKRKLVAEWRQAVVKLLEEIREHLAEYQADGSMSFTAKEISLSEEMLGKYRISAMDISASPAIIVVAPVGRVIVGATGRVDIYRQGRLGEADRIKLLRVPISLSDPTPRWVITPPPETGMPRTMQSSSTNRLGRAQTVALTKETLEQAIDFLLRGQ